MKRMFSGLQRRVSTFPSSQDNNSSNVSPDSSGNESPEETVAREIANDYLHLPAIVEAAESSATAAKEAAVRIRKYLSTPSKSNGSAQYNAVMLIRILAENPGHTFTRNIDAKFVSTVKDLLREGRDMSAQHMLRETLDQFETQNSWDEDLAGLLAMWKKEKARAAKYGGGQQQPRSSPAYHNPQSYHRHATRPRQLPPPDELAARVSEARTSANLLIQLAQSTPAAEVKDNELIKEFSERCSGAARSVQGYMAVENPPPDEDTMLTLIETNEHLSVALSKYQRAVLNARKATAAATNNNSSNGGGANNVNRNNNNNNNNDDRTGYNTNTNGQSAPSRPAEPVEPPRRVPSPPFFEEVPSLAPLSSTEEPHLSHSAFPELSHAKPSTTATPVAPVQPAQRRYEYDADEFQVENPFADSAADNDHFRSSSEEHARVRHV
ncbi:hypothetical protein PISL3812_06442 [Talaromyces islandicus]|uniref:GAT domain-containing protein n=1 Tax=Talaromyces islandicus TaxID=28573 RepID=A0A0U1M2V0_TALIS|nr:hypothetical protein PISL3812_06442 [Talaromyces islandicus]